MGMVPGLPMAMLACARLGAPHTVVFGGFSAEALADRLNDMECEVLITQDEAWRKGSPVPLKRNADAAPGSFTPGPPPPHTAPLGRPPDRGSRSHPAGWGGTVSVAEGNARDDPSPPRGRATRFARFGSRA